jgi:hypothetical protein
MFGSGIAVSLPGSHAAALRVSGSVFGYDELRDTVLPPELRIATMLVVEAAAKLRVPVRFVARPEVFTHGVLAERLAERLGGAADHVALCDGQAFRPLAGLRNHLFFYRRGSPDACAALRRLVQVAPELFAALASQVNGTLAFRAGGKWHRPTTTAMAFAETPRTAPPMLLPLFCHAYDPGRSADAAMSDEAAEATPPLAENAALRFVPLTESVLADGAFMRVLADRLLRAFMREEPPLLLQLPMTGAGDIGEQIVAVVRALAATGLAFPRHAAVSARWATGPLEAERMRGATILVHPGLDFWRVGRDVWSAAGEVEIVRPGPAASGFVRLFRDWLGGEPPARVLSPREARDTVTVGTVL